MKMYRDLASIKALADQTSATGLGHLLQARLQSLFQPDMDYTGLLLAVMVIEVGDTPADLEGALGFDVLHNRWNGLAYGQEYFTPSWDALEEHGDWFELTFILSDEGEGVVVFIPRGLTGPLNDLCQTYAAKRRETQ